MKTAQTESRNRKRGAKFRSYLPALLRQCALEPTSRVLRVLASFYTEDDRASGPGTWDFFLTRHNLKVIMTSGLWLYRPIIVEEVVVDRPEDRGWRIEDLITPSKERPIRNFIAGLSGRNLAEAEALIRLLEERGNMLRKPHSRALGNGLYELRRHQVRIFYMFLANRRIVLLDGIIKKQDKIPQGVLKRVRKFMADVLGKDKEVRSQEALD